MFNSAGQKHLKRFETQQISSNPRFTGHYSLITLLPNVYQENSQPFNAHIVPLLQLLYNPATKVNEKLSLFQASFFKEIVTFEF